MEKEWISDVFIRKLRNDEETPYELLLDADPDMGAISKYLGSSEIYVALLQNKIIGTFVLYPVDQDTREIKNIAVAERWQGKGIGTHLLNRATQIARTAGARKIMIATSNASIGPLYLYQKAGFDMDYLKKDFIIDNYPEPLFDNGIQCRHMIVLTKDLQ